MSTVPSVAPAALESQQTRLQKKPSKQDLTASGSDAPFSTWSRRRPRSRVNRHSRVGTEFTSAVSRPTRRSRVTEDPALCQDEQEKNEKRMRKRIFAVQELVESERQYSRTLQFMINVAIPLAQGYAPQPIGNVATREAYRPQGNTNPVGPPVLSNEDVNLVFGPGPYKLYQGSCHIINKLDAEILEKGFEKARVGKFLVFAVPFMEGEFGPYIARYRLANERWVALNALETPEMLQYKEAVKEQATVWSQAGHVVPELAATWSNISSLIAQSWYRWTKYALLVEAIIAHTRKEDPDYQSLEEARKMLKLANARINELGGKWTVVGALLSGKGIEGAVATRSNTEVKLTKPPLMARLFKRLEVDDPGLGLRDHLSRLKTLHNNTIDLVDNVRAWINAAAEGADSAILTTVRFADSTHGHRDTQWEEVFRAMVEDFEAAKSKLETTFEGPIFSSIEKLRHSMDGPLTVLEAALTMQRRYIAGMDYEAEGAKTIFDTYAEICAQLHDEIPKYVEVYLKGMSIIVLHLSTAQAQYYDDTSRVFEMVSKDKGLKGDSGSYRRDRPNGEAPKLRAVSVYWAMAEGRLPKTKEMEYGSYGCGEGHTRVIWEETAGNYLAQFVAGAATAEDRLNEWWEKHRGESTSNVSIPSLLGRLTSKSKLSIRSRSSPAINIMRDSPTSTPPESPLDTGSNVGQRSPSSPTPPSLPATGNLHPRQGSSERARPTGLTLQRTATTPLTTGLLHGPPARARFIPGHHRSQSHGYPLALNKSLPVIPSHSGGLLVGIPAGPLAVPPRPPGGHQRQRSEGQVFMEGLKSHIGQPGVQDDTFLALGKRPNARHGRQLASAQLATVTTNVPQPITKQFVKSNLTQKPRNHQQASGSMQPANASPSIAPQYHPHAKYSRSTSQPGAHGQPPAEIGCNRIIPPLPSRSGVPIAPRGDGNKASTSSPHPSNATVETSLYGVLPNLTRPPMTSPTRPSKPLSKSVPSTLDIGSRPKAKKVLRTGDLPPPYIPPVAGPDPVVRRGDCVPRGDEPEKSESHARDDSV